MSCARCHGRHVTTRPGPDAAIAERCECAAECPECSGEGWVHRQREDRTWVASRCGCQSLDRRIRLLNEARIPSRYHDRTLDNFVPRLPNHDYLMEYLRMWVSGFNKQSNGLLLCGPAGVGKTHLAVAVLRSLVERKMVAARFVEFFELLSDIRASFGTPGGERRVLGPLSEVPVLFMDELGKGKGGDWELSVLDQLIGARYNRNLPTVFTTNYPLRPTDQIQEAGQPVRLESLDDVRGHLGEAPLEERVGARIYSRVLDMCKPFVLRGAADFRLERVRDEEGP